MRNTEIADAFAELADRLALTDLKPYRYMAYRKAEVTFRDLGDSVAVLSREGRLREIDGVGAAIEEKVALLLRTGSFPALDRAREDVADTLLELTRLPGIGAATARKVHAALEGEEFESMLERAAAGTLPIGGGVTRAVMAALAAEASRRDSGADGDRSSLSGVPRGAEGEPLPGPWFRRDQLASMLASVAGLLEPLEAVDQVVVGGAYARGCELVQGMDLFVGLTTHAPQLPAARAAILGALGARGFDHDATGDEAPLAIVSPSGMPISILVAAADEPSAALQLVAGPRAWSALVHEPDADTVPIELRDAVLAGRWSITDAPRDLVEISDLRGELHAHSTWSDGRASILEMARAARGRGDEFFCVTDHSAPYAMVGGLGPDRLAEQAEEIAAANQQLAADHADGSPAFRVLRGSEVEVLADGSLGLPDSALKQLDWVVASIHVSQRQSADVILERMRRVTDNPLVDAIGHPTSRRLLARERTALDVGALIEMAAATDVVLEVNANPDRLDLDSTHAALALAAGVRLTVNTDAHRTSTLALREHGVVVARRAGARASDVVNCLPVEELLAGRRRER